MDPEISMPDKSSITTIDQQNSPLRTTSHYFHQRWNLKPHIEGFNLDIKNLFFLHRSGGINFPVRCIRYIVSTPIYFFALFECWESIAQNKMFIFNYCVSNFKFFINIFLKSNWIFWIVCKTFLIVLKVILFTYRPNNSPDSEIYISWDMNLRTESQGK